eukprot:500914_1
MGNTSDKDNFSIDKKCDGSDTCQAIQRLIPALSYYHQVSDRPSKFIDYCNKHYSKQYLEDYIHFISLHKNNRHEIQQNTKHRQCSNVNSCTSTLRHYRDRERIRIENKNDQVSHMCIDIFDNLHFYIYHMEETGLRLSMNKIDDHKDDFHNDDSKLKDEKIAAIQKEIEIKQKKCGEFKRLDGTKNSKFNILKFNYDTGDIIKQHKQSIWKKAQNAMNKHLKNENNKNADEDQTEETFIDELIHHINSLGVDEKIVNGLKEYLYLEEYDTESIQNDIDIYIKEKHCNLLEVMGNNVDYIEMMKHFVKTVTVSSVAFSTGFVFWYWNYYKNINQDAIKYKQIPWGASNEAVSSQNHDFGGHSLRDLYVEKYFKSLKQEILQSNLITLNLFKENVIEKCNQYFDTQKCKNIKCTMGKKGKMDHYAQDDPLHFGIKYGAKLKKSHLHSLVLYCDFTDFCTNFSSSFRKVKWNETLQSVKQRNRKYFHISKNLREVIQYYGMNNGGKYEGSRNGTEQGPYFTGISFVLHIPEFSIRLNGPNSTTLHKEIAIRFAGRDGMMLQLNNKGTGNMETFFNVSWLSGYAEEDERIFCGGRYPLQLESVIIMETQNNYKSFITAFFKLDQALGGWSQNVKDAEFRLIRFLVENCLEEIYKQVFNSLVQPMIGKNVKVDEFVKDTFFLFRQQKTKIILNLPILDRRQEFARMIVPNVVCTNEATRDNMGWGNEIPTNGANLFAPWIFNIFPNLKEIIIYSTSARTHAQIWSCNMMLLLEMLVRISLPKSFESVIIKDPVIDKANGGEWLKNAYSINLKEKYAANQFKIEYKRTHSTVFEHEKTEDWIIVTV